jgi:RecJ-like exonuclease
MFQEYEPIPFRVWHEENREDLEKEFTVLDFVADDLDCPKCDGFGVLECDLDHDHECSDCEGTGKNDQSYDEALSDYSHNQYHEQVKKDKEKLKVYCAS